LSFTSEIVPDFLKLAKVISVFKKGDRTQAGNYRPISLLTVFDKILEKGILAKDYVIFSSYITHFMISSVGLENIILQYLH